MTRWRGPSPCHCSRATQLLSKKCGSVGQLLATLCGSVGQLLATLCSISPTRDLNLRPPAPETNALPLDQLAGKPLFNYAVVLAGHISASLHLRAIQLFPKKCDSVVNTALDLTGPGIEHCLPFNKPERYYLINE